MWFLVGLIPISFLLNLTNKGLTGKEAEEALDAAGIVVNKNGVPFDEKPPMVTSGIRIGTPIVSTRGMGASEMKQIVSLDRSSAATAPEFANFTKWSGKK